MVGEGVKNTGGRGWGVLQSRKECSGVPWTKINKNHVSEISGQLQQIFFLILEVVSHGVDPLTRVPLTRGILTRVPLTRGFLTRGFLWPEVPLTRGSFWPEGPFDQRLHWPEFFLPEGLFDQSVFLTRGSVWPEGLVDKIKSILVYEDINLWSTHRILPK